MGLRHVVGGFAHVSLSSSWFEAWMADCTGLLSKETRQEMRITRDFHHLGCIY